MERNQEISVLLLALLQVCLARLESCTSQPALPTDLTCYTDYNTTISCAWNITKESDHRDAACTLLSTHKYKNKTTFSASCRMEPADVSGQNIRRCTLDFKAPRRFTTAHNLSMSLSCDPGKHILTVYFRPACNIKLKPPGRPDVNLTTVSWLPIFGKSSLLVFISELQWKTQDQSWSDPSVQKQQTKTTSCMSKCEAQLDPESLVQGETYEARIRVQPDQAKFYMSVWSDWGPTASWESPVGRMKPTQPPDFVRDVAIIITGATLALFLAGVLFKNDKAIWVYRKMRGQPPPDPGKSSLKDLHLQHWSPYFTRESLHSSLKTEDINSVEVISTMDNDTFCSKEVALLDKMRKERMRIESTSSSFSNPIYSQLCPPPPPPDAMGTAESLEPCDNDPRNSSTGCQDKGESAEKNVEEERMKEMQIVQLLSKRKNNNSEHVQVVSGYEKVEKLQAERTRLQSLDSGVCSGEDVSQESLETDSVNVSDGHEEGPESREVVNEKEVIFQKLFGGDGGSVVCKGSVQVCSDYEQVHKLQPSSPELLSVDSGVNSGGEEQVSHEESLEDIDSSTETTHFLFPPTRCILPCAVPSFSQMSLSGTDLSRALQPSSLSQIVGKAAMLSLSRSMETSGDGYMPVRQESG